MDLKQAESLLRPDVGDDIVADDCVASVRHVRSPMFDLNPVQYNRCDSGYSGFNSGLDQFHQKIDLNSQQLSEKNNAVQYQRLDSGVCSAMSSLNLYEQKIPSDQKGTSPIHKPNNEPVPQANLDRDQEFIEELFEQDIEGDTQLHLAIASSYDEVFNALVRLAPKPEYLNIQNNELFAPLHIAVLTNQPQMVRRLVVAGATTQITDQEGNTPLHHACSRGFMECASMLLKPIGSEEVRDQSVGSEHNQLHEVLDQRNHKGEHCLHLATFGRHYQIIRFLCDKGANMNSTEGRSGKTALHYAVNMRDHDLVQFLAGRRDQGFCQVELDNRDWSGRTPIQCAMINGDDYIVAVLESLGADNTTNMESEDSEDIEDEVDTYPPLEVSRVLQLQA